MNQLKSQNHYNVLDFKKICVFLFNTDKTILTLRKHKFLCSDTFGKNKNVVISIKLALFELLGEIIDIKNESVVVFVLSEIDYICCCCIVKNTNYCFENNWVSIDKINTLESLNTESVKIWSLLENHIKKYAEKYKNEFKSISIIHEHNLKPYINSIVYIYTPFPENYHNFTVKNVFLLLFNQKGELFFLKENINVTLPYTTNTSDTLFTSILDFFEKNYNRKLNIEIFFTKMIHIKKLNVFVFFARCSRKKTFISYGYEEESNFNYEFYPVSVVKSIDCLDFFSKNIFKILEEDIKIYLEKDTKYKINLKNSE
jgi:hypothetical protein